MLSGTIRTRDRLRFGRGHESKVTAIAVFERGRAVQRPSVSAGAIGKLWGLREIQIGDRIGGPGTAPSGGSSSRRLWRPWSTRATPTSRPAARRARTADGAGPPHRPSPGRRQAGAVGLAVRRGSEGSHRGDARRRLRHRGHVPRLDADLRRTPHRDRGGARAPARRVEPLPGGDRLARRPRSARRRHRLPVRRRSAHRAAVPLQDGRELQRALGGLRARGAAGGAVRLAGHRLRRNADGMRLQRPGRAAVEARAAEHGGGLQEAHAAGRQAGARARAGRSSANRSCGAGSRSRRARSAWW